MKDLNVKINELRYVLKVDGERLYAWFVDGFDFGFDEKTARQMGKVVIDKRGNLKRVRLIGEDEKIMKLPSGTFLEGIVDENRKSKAH